MARLGDHEIRVKLDDSQVPKKLLETERLVQAKLRKLEQLKTNIPLDIDQKSLDREIKSVKAKLARQRLSMVVKVDTDQRQMGFLRNFFAQAKAGTRNVDQLGGAFGQLGLRIKAINVGPLILSAKHLGPLMAGLVPIAVNLTGALAALAGSLGAGLIGAITASSAALTTWGVGFGAIYLAIAPMISKIGRLKKASAEYTTAVYKYGKGSEEAAKKLKIMEHVTGMTGPRVAQLAENVRGLVKDWKTATASIRPDFFSLIARALNTARSLMPQFAAGAVQSFRTVAGALEDLLARMKGPEFRSFLTTMFVNFKAQMRDLIPALGNIGAVLGRVFMNAAPHVTAMISKFRRWSEALNENSKATGGFKGWVDRMMSSLRDLGGLLRASGNLISAFFGAGKVEGDNMIRSLTRIMDKTAAWIRTAEGQTQIKQFFRDAAATARIFANVLVGVADAATTAAAVFSKVGRALGFVKSYTDPLVDAIGNYLVGALAGAMEAVRGFARIMMKIPGASDDWREVADTADAAAKKLNEVRHAVNKIPDQKKLDFSVDVGINYGGDNAMGAGGAAPKNSRQGSGWPVDLEGEITERVKGGVARRAKKAAKSGALGGVLGGKAGSGSVNMFNPVAAGFGNQVTSGFRKGDPGYHGQNRARDYAGGNMLAFARYMAATFGRGLKELIHTPLGFSIKNGKKVAPYAKADHYDHVHVAKARGGALPQGKVTKPTTIHIGEEAPTHPEWVISTNPRDRKQNRGYLAHAAKALGFKKGGELSRTRSGEGKGVGMTALVALARSAGLTGRRAAMAAAIAMGESGGNPGAHNTKGEDSRGLWQINVGPGANTQYRKTNLFDPRTNAKVMAAMSGGGKNFGPWTVYTKGVYKQFLKAAMAALDNKGAKPGNLSGSTAPSAGELRQQAREKRSRSLSGGLARIMGSSVSGSERASSALGLAQAGTPMGPPRTFGSLMDATGNRLAAMDPGNYGIFGGAAQRTLGNEGVAGAVTGQINALTAQGRSERTAVARLTEAADTGKLLLGYKKVRKGKRIVKVPEYRRINKDEAQAKLTEMLGQQASTAGSLREAKLTKRNLSRYGAPTIGDITGRADPYLAIASLTEDTGDDLGIMQTHLGDLNKAFESAKGYGDVLAMGELAGAIKGTQDAIAAIGEAAENSRIEGATRTLNINSIWAGMSGDRNAMMSSAQSGMDFWMGEMNRSGFGTAKYETALGNYAGAKSSFESAQRTLLWPEASADLENREANMASAQLTPGLEDDRAAAASLVDLWEHIYKHVRGTFPRSRETEAANALKGARDNLSGIEGSAGTLANQTQTFNSARYDLVRSMGSNFRAGSAWNQMLGPIAGPQGANAAYAGGTTVYLSPSFANVPPDPLTWSKNVAWDLKAAL